MKETEKKDKILCVECGEPYKKGLKHTFNEIAIKSGIQGIALKHTCRECRQLQALEVIADHIPHISKNILTKTTCSKIKSDNIPKTVRK